jgi:hypothetical protein
MMETSEYFGDSLLLLLLLYIMKKTYTKQLYTPVRNFLRNLVPFQPFPYRVKTNAVTGVRTRDDFFLDHKMLQSLAP